MCIVLDTCTFSTVFSRENHEHDEFKPVFDWIINGKGKIVFGGKKYKDELAKTTKYRRLFLQLEKIGKIVKINDKEVDDYQAYLVNKIAHKDFDDPHLIAIISISHCKLICTNERRSIPFLRDTNLYPNNKLRPSIYSGKRNHKLLNDNNIANICKPALRSSKKDCAYIETVIT